MKNLKFDPLQARKDGQLVEGPIKPSSELTVFFTSISIDSLRVRHLVEKSGAVLIKGKLHSGTDLDIKSFRTRLLQNLCFSDISSSALISSTEPVTGSDWFKFVEKKYENDTFTFNEAVDTLDDRWNRKGAPLREFLGDQPANLCDLELKCLMGRPKIGFRNVVSNGDPCSKDAGAKQLPKIPYGLNSMHEKFGPIVRAYLSEPGFNTSREINVFGHGSIVPWHIKHGFMGHASVNLGRGKEIWLVVQPAQSGRFCEYGARNGYAFRNCKHEVVRGTFFPTTAGLLEAEFFISWFIVEPGDLIILGPGVPHQVLRFGHSVITTTINVVHGETTFRWLSLAIHMFESCVCNDGSNETNRKNRLSNEDTLDRARYSSFKNLLNRATETCPALCASMDAAIQFTEGYQRDINVQPGEVIGVPKQFIPAGFMVAWDDNSIFYPTDSFYKVMYSEEYAGTCVLDSSSSSGSSRSSRSHRKVLKQSSREASEDLKFICLDRVCKTEFSTKYDLFVHIKETHYLKDGKCPFCDYTNNNERHKHDNIRRHIKDKHLHLNYVTCPSCLTSLSHKRALEKHQQKVLSCSPLRTGKAEIHDPQLNLRVDITPRLLKTPDRSTIQAGCTMTLPRDTMEISFGNSANTGPSLTLKSDRSPVLHGPQETQSDQGPFSISTLVAHDGLYGIGKDSRTHISVEEMQQGELEIPSWMNLEPTPTITSFKQTAASAKRVIEKQADVEDSVNDLIYSRPDDDPMTCVHPMCSTSTIEDSPESPPKQRDRNPYGRPRSEVVRDDLIYGVNICHRPAKVAKTEAQGSLLESSPKSLPKSPPKSFPKSTAHRRPKEHPTDRHERAKSFFSMLEEDLSLDQPDPIGERESKIAASQAVQDKDWLIFKHKMRLDNEFQRRQQETNWVRAVSHYSP